MKKSRIAKLALLGASTAALAATLTTSTYAWYVSNKTASVNTVTGKTAQASSDGSIALSATGKEGTFYNKISITATGAQLSPRLTTDGVNFTAFGTTDTYFQTPDTALDATATYYTRSGSAEPYTYTAVAQPALADIGTYYEKGLNDATNTTGYYTYTFWIMAGQNCTVTPALTIKNTTETPTTQANYSTLTSITGPQNGAQFVVDALDSMSLSLTQNPGSFDDNNDGAYVGTTESSATGGIITNSPYITLSRLDTTGFTVATAGAHKYYQEITGYGLTTAQTTQWNTTNSMTTLSLTANTPTKLTYRLFLDGADDLCFNACELQDFSIAFSYTVTSVA